MPLLARRFNDLFRYRWDRIVDFLKLHYVLSERDTPYWRAHRDPQSWTASLRDQLELWRTQPPSPADFAHADEIFPAASHQYVLYGMGATPPPAGPLRGDPGIAATLHQVRQRARTLGASLPTNRAYLRAIAPPAGMYHV